MLSRNEAYKENLKNNKDIDNIFLSKKENIVHEKNIENLVNEIKEAEKKIQKDLKESKIPKKRNTRISMPKIELSPINIQTIQYILSSKNRNHNMLIVLNALLSNVKFVTNVSEQDKEKLIASLSNCLKMEKRQKGCILFRYGNKGTRLYIVLGGEISVLILKEVEVELTFLNYIKYLFYLRIIKEEELAKKIVGANLNCSFRITERYLDIYYEDILSFINKYYIMTTFNEYEEKKYTSVKKILKLNSINILGEQNQKILKENNKLNLQQINNQFRLNKKDIKTFKRQTTINESRLNSVILHKNEFLSNQNKEEENKKNIKKTKIERKVLESDERIQEKDGSSEHSENWTNSKKEGTEYMKEKLIKRDESTEFIEKSSENKPIIKYKATSKIPNYFELDIGSLGPHDLANLVNYVIRNLEMFSQKPSKVNNINDYIKLCSLDDNLKISDKNIKKERITIYKYFEVTKKVEGDIFGELALQHADSKRTATMIVTKDSVFGCLSKSDYNLSLRGIEMKRRKIDINFILSFSIFEEQNWLHFEKQYFNFFKKETFTSGQVIINQNEKIENVYFIMEGQFEISTKLVFNDIVHIIKQKNKRIKPQKSDKNKDIDDENKSNSEKDENSNEEININDINENINEEEYIKMHTKKDHGDKIRKKYNLYTKKQIKQLKEPKIYRLCVVDNRDIIGLNDICTNDKISFIRATCISSDAVVFSIKINILEQLRKKNWKMERNIQEICQRREKNMIERLKILTNQVMMNIKQTKHRNILDSKENENTTINKEKRIITALKTHYFTKTSSEKENKIIKDKNLELLNPNTMQKNYLKNENNINKKNKIISKAEISLDDSPKRNKRKNGFKKFMESVTERVNQINHHKANFFKFSRLFCPVNNKKSKIDSEKKIRKKMILKLKEPEIIKKNLKTENNIINIKKISTIDENNTKSLSPLILNKEKRILSNKYLNKIITTNNLKEKISFSDSNDKTIYKEKIPINKIDDNYEQINKDYIKRILGVRYREYETSEGQKTFTKLMIPNIKNFQYSKNYNNKKKKYKTIDKNKQQKPIKVDLLFYDQLTKKNKSSYLKDIIIERQIKQRIISRNLMKNFRTINIEKTEKVYY